VLHVWGGPWRSVAVCDVLFIQTAVGKLHHEPQRKANIHLMLSMFLESLLIFTNVCKRSLFLPLGIKVKPFKSHTDRILKDAWTLVLLPYDRLLRIKALAKPCRMSHWRESCRTTRSKVVFVCSLSTGQFNQHLIWFSKYYIFMKFLISFWNVWRKVSFFGT
jgi:hypothetical protein